VLAIAKDIVRIAAVFAVTFVAGYAATVRARRSVEVPVPSPDRVIIAELFTSEGCTGCRLADRVLAQVVDQPLVRGLDVLGLVETVN